MKPRLVILASGTGTTFTAIAEACRSGRLNADLAGLVVSRDGAPVIDRAEEYGVPTVVVELARFKDRSQWDRTMTAATAGYEPTLVALAGFTQLLGPEFLKTFERRVVNTHPSLLPKYGGPGMYGRNVHEAVLRAKEKESGVSVHWVAGEYDSGPVIAQKPVPVYPGDTARNLAERVQGVEKDFYISVLSDLLTSMSQ